MGKLADGISIPCSQTNHAAANYLWSPKHCLINLLGWRAGLACQLTQGADDTRYFSFVVSLASPGEAEGCPGKITGEAQPPVRCPAALEPGAGMSQARAWLLVFIVACRLFRGYLSASITVL